MCVCVCDNSGSAPPPCIHSNGAKSVVNHHVPLLKTTYKTYIKITLNGTNNNTKTHKIIHIGK